MRLSLSLRSQRTAKILLIYGESPLCHQILLACIGMQAVCVFLLCSIFWISLYFGGIFMLRNNNNKNIFELWNLSSRRGFSHIVSKEKRKIEKARPSKVLNRNNYISAHFPYPRLCSSFLTSPESLKVARSVEAKNKVHGLDSENSTARRYNFHGDWS